MMRRLKMLVHHNMPAKVIALVVAVTLWGVVMEDQNPFIEDTVTLNVKEINQNEDYRVMPERAQVKIRVRGQRSTFLAVENSEEKGYVAYVDMSGYGEGTYRLRPQVTMPAGLELLEMTPDVLDFTFEAIITKSLPIELIVNGATAPGAAVAKITQEHDSVAVTGPRSLVDKTTRVIGYVGLSGNDADFSLDVPLTAINDDGRQVAGVRLALSAIHVNVQLARGLTKKIVSVKPVLTDHPPEGYLVKNTQVDPQKIEVAGDEDAIATLTVLPTEPVTLTNAVTTFTKTVKLSLPEGVTVTNPIVNVKVVVEELHNKEKKAVGDKEQM